MRLGFNGTAYDSLSSGARDRFTNLYGALIPRSAPRDCIVYSPRELSLAALMNGSPEEVRTPLSPARPMVRFLRSAGWFRRRLARDGVDLFVTDHFPVIEGKDVSTLLTIHDLRFLSLPGEGSLLRRTYFRSRYAKVAARAKKIVTVSKAMAEEIGELLGIRPDRVEVVPNGVREDFRRPPEEVVDRLRRRFALPGEFLLHVGVLERRKNLGMMLEVLAANPDLPPLVLAGRGGPEEPALRRSAGELGLRDRVLFAGYVPEPDLPALYSAASAVVVPSIYEGFGLPVLQGFACEVPVVTAATPALREVGGDAALIADAAAPEAWSDAITRAISDSAERARLTRAGLARARAHTWTTAAERLREVLSGMS